MGYFFGIIPAITYLIIKIKYKTWYKEIGVRIVVVLFSTIIIAGIGKGFYQDYASFFRNNKSITHLLLPSNFIGASISKVQEKFKQKNALH